MAASRPNPLRPLPFDGLRLDPSGPPGNAWGRFGPSDNLGMLNLLTPSVVASTAASEIRSGIRISLDWPLNKPFFPSYGRPAFQHKIIHKAHPDKPDRPVNDDVVTFNTQSSSQWDGFRHYGNYAAGRFYGGVTLDEIHSSSARIGIDAVAEAGGIVGRGVLLDFAAYADKHGIELTPFKNRGIPLDRLRACAEEQGVEFQPGDVLFLRSGFARAYGGLSPEEQEALPKRELPEFAGVESCEEMLRWIWERQFSAVAGDAPAFEQSPVSGSHGDPGFVLHQWLLPLWGMPIGEMFDLEKLGEECTRLGRWTFFLSSVPLKIPGGVASPPNAIAIF